MVETQRKGAARIADVPPEILDGLNTGQIQAATLVENLATDFAVLLTNTLPELADPYIQKTPAKTGITKRMATVALLFIEKNGAEELSFLSGHKSDLVRGWGAYVQATLPDLTLQNRIERMRIFADDPHFGVREWAWLALRPHVVQAPLLAIKHLEPWVTDPSENIRRFAIEATRPRGVWSAHIKELKADPSPALSILNPVKSDPARYVQDSVANWLNDAWKTSPDWVEKLCRDWSGTNCCDHTQYITRRALRNKKD